MSVVAGLRLSIGPETSLGPRERAALLALRPAAPPAPGEPVFSLALEPRGDRADGAPAPAGPAQVAWSGDRLLLMHTAFEAEIDPTANAAVVRRDGDDPTGLVTTLRTAASARLPLDGGVVVHAAALAHRGRGWLFFGPSGIGKSTLAQRSPWRVLSDELAAVLPRYGRDARLLSNGALPEPHEPGRTSTSAVPLAFLVELAQGPCFHLEQLGRATALRRLLGSIVVPPGPPLWAAALRVAGDLVLETPCYRMAWSLDASPFEPLEAALEEPRAKACLESQ